MNYEKYCKKMANFTRRKEEIRLERTKDEPIREEWRGKQVYTLLITNDISGEVNKMEFKISRKRINSFDIWLNGALWKKTMSMSRAMAGLRKSLKCFSVID